MAETPLQSVTQTITENAVRVFSMPPKYRHGASVNMVVPPPSPSNSPSGRGSVPVPAPIPPKPIVPLPPASVQKLPLQQPSHTKKGLIIAGVIVLVALGISGYLVLRSSQKNTAAMLAKQQAEVSNEQGDTSQNEAVPVLSEQTQTTEQTPITETSVPVVSANPFPSAATPGTDTDSDGLTDTEETIVYGTNPNLPDSDGDGFLDGNETFHGYNPSGTAPGTLVLANLAQILSVQDFELLYPSKWTALPAQSGDGSVVSASTGENVTITLMQKASDLSLADWYAQTIASADGVGTPSVSKSKKGYGMLVAKNQLSVYLDLGDMVVRMTYDTSTKSTIDYQTTFQMMVNSVEGK